MARGSTEHVAARCKGPEGGRTVASGEGSVSGWGWKVQGLAQWQGQRTAQWRHGDIRSPCRAWWSRRGGEGKRADRGLLGVCRTGRVCWDPGFSGGQVGGSVTCCWSCGAFQNHGAWKICPWWGAGPGASGTPPVTWGPGVGVCEMMEA